MATEHDGFIYGLDALEFAGKELGLISNDSIDWGGDEPSTVKIWAAQKRTAPAKELLENPGTDELSFDLIKLKPANIAQVMGGTVSEDGKKWNAPSKRVVMEGPAMLRTADGSKVDIGTVSLIGFPRGKFGYSDVFKIHCKMTVTLPEGDASPYGIDTDPDATVVG